MTRSTIDRTHVLTRSRVLHNPRTDRFAHWKGTESIEELRDHVDDALASVLLERRRQRARVALDPGV